MKFPVLFILFISLTLSGQNDELKIADSLAAVGKHAEAIELLQNTEPSSEKIYLKLAQFQKNIDQNEGALENYRKVLVENPDRILTAQEYGELLLATGKLELADSVFTGLSKKYPDNAGFVYRLGLVKEKKKDSTAINYFFRTIRNDRTHQAALYKTAKYHLKNGKAYNAIYYCETGLKARPNNTSLLSILGQAYSASLQFEKAIVPYEKLVKLGEGSEFILEKLAKAYRVSSLPNKAIDTYLKILEVNKFNSNAHSNLGALYLKKNETEKARQHFISALNIKNQPVDNEYVNLGLAYKDQQEFRSAYLSFKNALKENPDNDRAQIELAIAADAYFKDKEAVLKLYQDFVDKYQTTGRKDMLSIAEYRISQLKKEIHLAE